MVMGQAVEECDVVVLGAGPGGYVAALRAAQLGKRVILVDHDDYLGGVCLQRGCIPSKALIHASEFVFHAKHAENMGVTVKDVSIDPPKMQEWKTSIIKRLSDGIVSLCKAQGVEVVKAQGYFQNSRMLGLEPLHEDEHLEYQAIEFRYCIVATGSVQRQLPGLERDGQFIVGSTEVLSFEHIPKAMVVIGGGYIGVEMATVYAKLGTKVTIVEYGDRLIPAVDEDAATVLQKHVQDLGIELVFNAQVSKADKDKKEVTITPRGDGEASVRPAEHVMVAVGRVPDTEPLRLKNTKIKIDDKGFIQVNDKRQTTDPHIYAIGDIAGGALLAHKASMEGRVAAEAIAGRPVAFDAQVIPAVIFCDPEIAMVGMTEKQVKDAGMEYRVGKYSFKSSGRALTMNQGIGFVKVIADANSHVILGVHIIGPDASDLISEATLAIEMGARIEDIDLTIHPHPTLSEALAEAMASILGSSVHSFGKKSSGK